MACPGLALSPGWEAVHSALLGLGLRRGGRVAEGPRPATAGPPQPGLPQQMPPPPACAHHPAALEAVRSSPPASSVATSTGREPLPHCRAGPPAEAEPWGQAAPLPSLWGHDSAFHALSPFPDPGPHPKLSGLCGFGLSGHSRRSHFWGTDPQQGGALKIPPD